VVDKNNNKKAEVKRTTQYVVVGKVSRFRSGTIKTTSQQLPKKKNKKLLIFSVGIIFVLVVVVSLSSISTNEVIPPVIVFKDTTQLIGPRVDGDPHIDFEISCPRCGALVIPGPSDRDPFSIKRCRRCGYPLKWEERIRCPYCKGSGVCAACRVMKQINGRCFNCEGEGYILPSGAGCPNCGGTGRCPVCDGSGKCPYCKGTGLLDLRKLWTIWGRKNGVEFEVEEGKSPIPKENR